MHYLTIQSKVGQSIKEGRQNVTDMPRPGHPAVREDDVQTVNALVLADQHITIRELANDAELDLLTDEAAGNAENRLKMGSI